MNVFGNISMAQIVFMNSQLEDKFIDVIPYRNSGIQVVFACVLFIPTSLFMIYAPFRDPCSPDRTSGDCSLGSPFMEQVYTVVMIGFGAAVIACCLYLVKRFYRNLIPHKGCRIAFTHESIVGPIWGFWLSPEEEIKFSEISELVIVQTHYTIMMKVATPDRKMLLQNTFLKDDDAFQRVYNHLAKALGKPSFEETATPEVLKAFVPFCVQIEEQKHLFSAFIYFLIGGALTLAFGSYAENQNNSDLLALGFFIPLGGFGYVVSKFRKKFWASKVGPMMIFLFLMLFGLFLGFIGTVGMLSF